LIIGEIFFNAEERKGKRKGAQRFLKLIRYDFVVFRGFEEGCV